MRENTSTDREAGKCGLNDVRLFERVAANPCMQAATWPIQHLSDLDRKIQTDFVLNLGKFAKSDDEQRDCRDGRRRPPASPALAQHAIGLNGVIE
jgi:hypothetical protein